MESKDIIIAVLFFATSIMFICSKPLQLAEYDRGAERRKNGKLYKNAQRVSKGINAVMNVVYAVTLFSFVAWIWVGIGK